jgi:hypothetical protein
MAFAINAGPHNGNLDTLKIRTGHDTAADALAAFQRYLRGNRLVAVQNPDGLYVYMTQEEADRDPDGSYATAVIEEEA